MAVSCLPPVSCLSCCVLFGIFSFLMSLLFRLFFNIVISVFVVLMPRVVFFVVSSSRFIDLCFPCCSFCILFFSFVLFHSLLILILSCFARRLLCIYFCHFRISCWRTVDVPLLVFLCLLHLHCFSILGFLIFLILSLCPFFFLFHLFLPIIGSCWSAVLVYLLFPVIYFIANLFFLWILLVVFLCYFDLLFVIISCFCRLVIFANWCFCWSRFLTDLLFLLICCFS